MTHAMLKRFSVFFLAFVFCAGVQLTATQSAQAQDASLSTAGSSNSAVDKQFGVGLSLGTMIGVNFQTRLNDTSALDFTLGGGFGWRNRHFGVRAQYIYKFNVGEWDVGRLEVFVGGGLQYASYRYGRPRIVSGSKNCETFAGVRICDNDTWGRGYTGKRQHWFGIRIPVGVSFSMKTAPVDFFVEFAPGMYFVKKPDMLFTFAFGARYWF